MSWSRSLYESNLKLIPVMVIGLLTRIVRSTGAMGAGAGAGGVGATATGTGAGAQ